MCPHIFSTATAVPGVLHCQHGQWGLEALIPWWFRAGTCVTSNPEESAQRWAALLLEHGRPKVRILKSPSIPHSIEANPDIFIHDTVTV